MSTDYNMSNMAFAGHVYSYGKQRGFVSIYKDVGPVLKYVHQDTKIIEDCHQPINHVIFADIGIGYQSLVAVSDHHVFVI